MKTSHRDMPPDGGWGWVVVAASFFLLFLMYGPLFSLSVLYVSWLEEFHALKGTTSWIVSVAAGISYSLAPLPAGVARRFGYRVVTLTGAFLCSIGFFLSYFATSVYFLMITIGVISGLGVSFCYLPALAMVGMYFCKRRAFAMGIATSGSPVGVFILPPFINWLEEKYTWRGTVLILSAFILNAVVCGTLMRPVEKEANDECRSMLDGEEKCDLKEGKEFAANEPVRNTHSCEHKEKACDTKLESYLPKESNDRNLTITKCVRMEQENRMSCSENSCHESVNTKTDLNSAHLRKKPNMGGSLKTLTSSIDDSPYIRTFSSEREINSSKKNGKSTNLIASRLHHLDISVGSSFHSLLLVNREIDSLLSVYSDCPDKTDEHEEEDTTTTTWCSRFASAFRPYLQLLRSSVFLLFGISNFLTNLSFLMPILYMVDRAVENNIDKASAAILLSIFGASSFIVRIVIGFVADCPCVNTLVCYILSLMICGVSTSLSAFCGDSLVLHGVYSFVYGGLIGTYCSLGPVVTAELLDAQHIGIAFSIILAFSGPATMIGSPLAGWIVDWTGSYNISFIINGIFLFVSAAMLLPIFFTRRKNIGKVRLADP